MEKEHTEKRPNRDAALIEKSQEYEEDNIGRRKKK